MPLAIDIGSTRIKAARMTQNAGVYVFATHPSPPVSGSGLIREADAEEYLRRASDLLGAAAHESPGGTLGLACQRSSFLVWEAESGDPVTPVISWQDRRAEAWCRERADLIGRVGGMTGLPLSPHYLGPKMRVMGTRDPVLMEGLHTGRYKIGTLDSFLIYRWTQGRVHVIDTTMAARTLLMELGGSDWSHALLDIFKVPRAALPQVVPTRAEPIELDNGLKITATIADQSAAALAVLGHHTDRAMVNLGTGGFILRAVEKPEERLDHYLIGPLQGGDHETGAAPEGGYAIEGTINGIGPTIEGFNAGVGTGPTDIPEADLFPSAFCLPESTGVGAPHWRADLTTRFSPQAQRLMLPDMRRVALEGVVFRTCEILDDFHHARPLKKILLSGGLCADPFISQALAAVTDIPVEIMREPEATLLGAAHLGAGIDPYAHPERLPIHNKGGAYLKEKYRRWKGWALTIMR